MSTHRQNAQVVLSITVPAMDRLRLKANGSKPGEFIRRLLVEPLGMSLADITYTPVKMPSQRRLLLVSAIEALSTLRPELAVALSAAYKVSSPGGQR